MERLTIRSKNSDMVWFKDAENGNAHLEPCEMTAHHNRMALDKLATYEDAEEQGQILRPPCKVGDTVYLIDRDENNKFKVYEGKWERVSLVQTSKDGSFNLCGEISYDIYDCFYDDGRIMKHGMYVGQESTKIGEIVFLTKEKAEAKLKEIEFLMIWKVRNEERRSYQKARNVE